MKLGTYNSLAKTGRLEEMPYEAFFEQADDGSVFVYVPDLPGCTSWGATLGEARAHVREAIALWLAVARENGEALRLVDDRVCTDQG